MNILLGMLLGYIAHDAIQPTPVGKVLDKIALPSDLLVTEITSEAPSDDQVMV